MTAGKQVYILTRICIILTMLAIIVVLIADYLL